MAKATHKDPPAHFSTLDDPAVAAAYVNAALEEEVEDEEELFLLALRTIAQAHGMSNLAAETTLKRENLYRMLSSAGNHLIHVPPVLRIDQCSSPWERPATVIHFPPMSSWSTWLRSMIVSL